MIDIKKSRSLKKRLIAIILSLSMIPFLMLATLSLIFFPAVLSEQVANQLISIRDIKKRQLQDYFRLIKNQAQYFAGTLDGLSMSSGNTPIIKYIDDFDRAMGFFYQVNEKDTISKLFSSSTDQLGRATNREFYDYTHEELHPRFESFANKMGFHNIYLFNYQGLVVYGVKKSTYFGTNIHDSRGENNGVFNAFKQAENHSQKMLASEPFYFNDFGADISQHRVVTHISIPVYKYGRFAGAIVYELTLDTINSIMGERSGLGDSGETYLVAPNHTLRSNVLRTTQSDSAYRSLSEPNGRLFSSAAIDAALAGQSGFKKNVSYLQDSVLSAYTPIDVLGLHWALIVDMTTAEAYQGVNFFKISVVFIACVAGLIIVVTGIYFARSVASPIIQLTHWSEVIAGGDLSPTLDIHREDELGRLARSFSTMKNAIGEKISEIERQNQSLKQLDTLKDNILANTSHELRTPINGIIGLAESLQGQLPSEQRSGLSTIIRNGYRLSNLINDILDAASLKNGNIDIKLESLNLRQMVDLDKSIVIALVGDKPIEINNEVPEELHVLADQNRLLQILQNLLGNAIKFTESGAINISAGQVNDQVEVAVSDSGCGIAPENLERIFQPFEQSDVSPSRRFSGTGLGLAITQQLVELLGGRISVESCVDEGSCFRFTLPSSDQASSVDVSPSTQLCEPADIALLPSSVDNASTGRVTLLAVDDEPVNLLVLKNHLSSGYFNLITAASAHEALSLIKKSRPDLILLDVMMPGMDGYELCEIIRQEHDSQDLPIVFLTARNQVNDLVKAFTVGGNDYLAKPYCREELEVRIMAQALQWINHSRLQKLHQLSNRVADIHSHEEVLKETHNLLQTDALVDAAAVYFDGELLFGDKACDLRYPDGLEYSPKWHSHQGGEPWVYAKVTDFYTVGVCCDLQYSESWLNNVLAQLRLMAWQVRQITQNAENNILHTEILPYLKDIYFIKSERNYCSVFRDSDSETKERVVRIPFKEVLFPLDNKQLLQVHRSYAINPSKIRAIYGKNQRVELGGDVSVPVSRKYLTELKRIFPDLYYPGG
jgi:two-component system, sensor histidine kinase ChiS